MSGTEKNPVLETLSRIEPAEGAKERILKGIEAKTAEREKAGKEDRAEQKPRRPAGVMKWILPAAACLLVAGIGTAFLTGALKARDPLASESVQLPNPFAPAKDAEEIQSRLGIVISVPEGAEDAEYRIIDGRIADIRFVYHGLPYTLRASAEDGDFSGIYAEEIRTENIDAETDAALTTYRSSGDTYRKLAWKDGGITYILSVFEGDSADDLIALYRSLR